MLRSSFCRVICLIPLFFALVSCAVHDDEDVISTFSYPNPCTAATGANITIKYQSSATGQLSLLVYVKDRGGNAVVVQRRSVAVAAGANTIEIPWNVTNDRGEYLAPGPYILKVTTEGLSNSLESHTAWNRILVK
jgi:hypothetical protein